jgi:hypothetical protein
VVEAEHLEAHMKRPKGVATKGYGNPVTEQRLYVEADPNGTRVQRRLWAKRYGKTKAQDQGSTDE